MSMYMRYKLGIDKSNCLTLPCKTARIFRTEYRLNYMKHILCDST